MNMQEFVRCVMEGREAERRKVFISHFSGDREEVDEFIDDYKDVFIPKVLGANDNDDFIDSTNTDYVMQQIRDRYLGDSTVTIVLIGTCTHSRRYVDWEIKSSLQQGKSLPNGLIGIVLPSAYHSVILPPRFCDNWERENVRCYARLYNYPPNATSLRSWIEDAHNARTSRARLIENSRDMMRCNARCKSCGIAH